MAASRERVIRNAEKFVSRGRIDLAVREYRKVLADHPKDANTLNRLGDLYARLQRFDEAVELFQRIAEDYTADGFFVKAIAIYKKIIKLDPTRLEVYERLADLYHKQGLVNEARTQYQVLADYYQKHDNTASAINVYQRMADLEPANPSHHVKLAEVYQREELVDRAMGEYAIIAELMLGHGHVEEAVQVYERGLDVDPSSLSFVRQAVEKLREEGQVSQAARLLTLAVEKNPEARGLAAEIGIEEEPAEPQPTAEEPAAEAEVAAGDEELPPAIEPEAASGQQLEATSGGELEEAEVPLAIEDEEAAGGVVLELDEGMPDTEALAEAADEAVRAMEAPAPAAAEEEAAAEDFEPGTATEVELDLDDVFTLDLDDEEMPASQVQPPPDMLDGRRPRAFAEEEAVAEPPAAELDVEEPVAEEPVVELGAVEAPPPAEEELAGVGAEEVEIDPDFLERTAAELQVEDAPSDGDLVTEAEVFAKYGLESKAIDRLEEALKLNPRNLEAHALLVRVHLDQKHFQRIPALAARMAKAAAAVGDDVRWPAVRDQLAEAGFEVADDQVAAPPKRRKKESRIDQLLESLLEESGGRKKAPKGKPERASWTPVEEAEPAEAGPAPTDAPARSGEEAIVLGGIFEEVPVEEAPVAAEGDGPGALEETGVSWLDEVESARQAAGVGGEEVFADEDDFFDLGAELEQELSEEEALGRELAAASPQMQPREQSLEEIVEGFKKGVAENLSSEDYDTHFNLGIAYREMGLLDEAIGEFQLAAKDRVHLVECCSMLGLCFLDKGLPELAVKWYRRGLETPDLSEEETLGLLYDMGNVYVAMGDEEAAYKTFVEIYGVNTNYRDVVAKLEELA